MKVLGVLISTWIVVLCLLAPPAMAGVTPAERTLVRALSSVRVKHGLSPLRGSRSLARSAGRYSRWQLHNEYFGHQPRIRMSRHFRVGGEVIRLIWGWHARIRRTVRLWMHSPSHRAAILYPAMRRAGAGIVRGRFRGHLSLMVTVHLGGR